MAQQREQQLLDKEALYIEQRSAMRAAAPISALSTPVQTRPRQASTSNGHAAAAAPAAPPQTPVASGGVSNGGATIKTPKSALRPTATATTVS